MQLIVNEQLIVNYISFVGVIGGGPALELRFERLGLVVVASREKCASRINRRRERFSQDIDPGD
jgi:hypothetical protein